MRLDWANQTYFINFQHDIYDEPRYHHGVWVKGKTVCTIEQGPKDEPIITGYGEAYCSEDDQFQKELGRRMSLTRALEMLWPDSREARRAAWKVYHERR